MLILLLAFSINKTYAQTNLNVYQNPGAASTVQTATALTPEQQANVTQLMANMTPDQKKAFALGMTGKEGAGRLGGYEVSEQYRLGY